MMWCAVPFGPSMDYEVLLLSRVSEGGTRTGDAGASVADGVAFVARVGTAAASVVVDTPFAHQSAPSRKTRSIDAGNRRK